MKKHLFFYFFLLSFLLSIQPCSAQYQIVVTGGVAIGTGGQISFTMGQLAYTVQSSPAFSILVGIQQPRGVITFPIELLYFRAASQGADVNLSWATGSELNNNYFTVERSAEGVTWEVIDQIPSSGNSQELTRYKTVDKNPYPGVSYYRLKQTDLDGTFNYSDIASTILENTEIQVYPNPASDFLLLITDENIADLHYVLYDVEGKTVKTEPLNSGETIIEVKTLPKGIYHLVLSTESEILKSESIIKN